MPRVVLLSLFMVLPLLGGCEINPETGSLVFNTVKPEDERKIRAEAPRQVLTEFGGVYYDPALAAYVERVGQKMSEQSKTRNFDYQFTILDSPSINAFALPGGYIYVTRGLLALISSEAELASVLGHELAHVTARHGAQRLSRMKAEERFCAAFLCDFELPVLSDMAAIGMDLTFGGFTQDQELEADELGIRYLKSAGYDPHSMTSFLKKLKAQTDLEAEIAGLTLEQRKARGYSSTHPLTVDRIAQSSELTGDMEGAADTVGKRDYLVAIDGLLYGNRREYGFVTGKSFLHPIRRIAFDVPEGYTLYPASRRVTVVGADGAIMLFEPSRKLVRGPVLDYLETIWAEGIVLQDSRRLTINGMEAATGWMRSETEHGLVDFRLVAIRVETGNIYRFLFISPSAMTPRLSEGMRGITYSFRMIDEKEAAQLQPLRIRIVSAGKNDSLSDLASQSSFTDHAVRRFSVLNDLDGQTTIEPGRIVKLVKK
ncbi:MAG: M48 family metalloprotease [Proteobacteria bacterium]|nr:M48 family metalloprotease [Pseudomonadota bacterium]